MVEIAKALSFNSRVLIMDEPTAALNDAEIAELFKMIRELKSRGVGIIYISHKMDELKQIADRVTVLRDGEYVGTVDAASTSMATIIGMMVGRTISDERVVGTSQPGEVALDVRHLECGPLVRDVSFSVRRGEILGFAGLMGAGRTEVARAVFGADRPQSGEVYVHGKKRAIRTPEHAVAAGVGYLSEDRKRFGLATRHGRRSQCRDVEPVALSVVRRLSQEPTDAPGDGEIHPSAQHPHAVGGAESAAAVGRQPAEGRDREMARP